MNQQALADAVCVARLRLETGIVSPKGATLDKIVAVWNGPFIFSGEYRRKGQSVLLEKLNLYKVIRFLKCLYRATVRLVLLNGGSDIEVLRK